MKKILLILFVGLFQNFIFGYTISSNVTGVKWKGTMSGSSDYFAPSAPTNIRGDNATCSGYTARWDGSATKFYIDVATANTFASGTIVSAYDNKDLGNVSSVNLTGLNPGITYYFRLRAWDSSGYSSYSSTGTFTTLSVAVPTNPRSDNVNWCTSTIRWDGSATKFYLDVATNNTFSVGSILPAYNNLDVGNVNSLTLSGLSPNTTYYFRVRRLEACGLSGNSSVSNFTTMTIASPVATSGSASCNDWVAQWNGVYNVSGNQVDGYYLDVAIDNAFTNYVSGYQNLYVGNVNSHTITGLARGGVYYYRLRASTSCGIGGYSNVVSFTEKGNNSSNPGTIGGGASSICVGGTTTFTKDPNTWPSTGTWSIFNQTGSATITQAGVVTGVSAGTVLVVFTTYNGCGTSTSRSLTIDGATFTTFPSSPVCTNVDVTYTTQSGKSNYVWTIPGTLGTDYTISAGSTTTNSVTLKWLTSGSKTVTVNYSGACSGPPATNTVIVNSLPAAAGTITGASSVCQGQTNVSYSVPVIANATSYIWSYSGTGATITGTTNTPTITFASNATSGNLTVYGVNSCGNGIVSANYAITVSNSAPATPGTITQPINKCAGSTGNIFSIVAVTGATSYSWSVTGTGWAITAGGTTTSAAITIGSGVGTVSVTATNACGTSSTSTTGNITPNSLSVAPTGISGTTTICNGNSTTLTLTGGTSGSGATARWYSGSCGGTLVGTGNSISVSPTTTTNYYVRYEGTCNTTTCASTTVTVNFPSVAPTGITGTTTICNGGSTTLTVNGGTLGTGATVQWFTGSCGGTSAGTGNSITVSPTSNTTYYVRYSGTCNTTTCASQLVTVNSLPGTPAATAATDVTCSSFLANWTAASNATGYYLDVSTVNNFSGILPAYNGLDIGLVSSYNVTGLDKKTTYFYRLRAYNSCSSSVNSNYIQIKTLDVPKATISGTTAVCRNAASPVITFSNSEDSPITVTYNINGGANSTINVGANATATVSVPTGASGTFTYNLVSAAYQSVTSCLTSLSGSATVTVNPTPTPTFTTAAQAQTCADTHITYATQSGQSNYVWTVSGVLNTDYRLIARGTSTNHDIVIEWLTAGSKTVTVNYNNSNGCSGASPATYTTNVQVVDRGQVNGGRENLCKGDALPTLTLHSIAGNTIAYPDASLVLKWQYSDNADNSDWQDIAGTAGQISYSPTAFPGAFRTYQVVLQSSNGCTKTSIPSRIRFQAFSPPTNGVVINTSCTGSTGSVVLNGLPTGNWTLYRTGTSNATITGTGASITISNLAAGSYSFTYREGNCTSDPLVVTITRAANTWDGTKWSKTNNTTLPTADDSIVFEGNYTLTSDISACSCTVNSGSVVVNSGRTLTITNEVTVNGGSLTFENNASLIQTTNAINSGSIIYKRSSQPMKRYDFTYWSSPV
ncbi:fibronectin type III domain-containing protein, partial [Flavobacterium fluviatile]|uniref:Ig-like domain-containing protein n=1 Tax=Flavobacterium fluviatile TaxID=1862387 RepID=UPI0013D7A6FA